ncbi:MAG: EamA family transporter, partial [Pseudomonadota bacterium]
MKFPPAQLAFIGLALTSLFWASNAIIARYISDSIPPFTLAFGRWLIAFVILIPFVAKSLYDQRHEIIKHYLVIAILGFLCIGTYNTILY